MKINHKKFRIRVLNGANLDLLGTREVNIYGTLSLGDIEKNLRDFSHYLLNKSPNFDIDFKQTNQESQFIEWMDLSWDGYIINPGAWTHTSMAIADRVRSIHKPVIEVHLSHILAREEYRKTSLVAQSVKGSIMGFGYKSYEFALISLLDLLANP